MMKLLKDGKDASNQAQEKLNKMEKSLLKILSLTFSYNIILTRPVEHDGCLQ